MEVLLWVILIGFVVFCVSMLLLYIHICMLGKKAKKISISDIEMEKVKNYLKQLNETIDLINTTKEPEVFIKRYKFAIEVCKNLTPYEEKVKFDGTLPSTILQELENLEYKKSYEKKFILRCSKSTEEKMDSLKTEKGQLNRVSKFYNNFEVNFEFFSDSSINLIESEYDRLINVVVLKFKEV